MNLILPEHLQNNKGETKLFLPKHLLQELKEPRSGEEV